MDVLGREIERASELASEYAASGDEVSGVIPTEPVPGSRIYVCSFDGADGLRSWLAVRGDGSPVTVRSELRGAVSVAALCELAADAAGGGDVDALIERLEELRRAEAPPGIEGAEEAARALRAVVGDPPRLATPERLDAIGTASRRLELELDPTAASPFAATLRGAEAAVAELQREIEAGYRLPLT
ncbi:MAG: hypothetical protein R6W48_09910 [Gaiellaceae bacterium]